MERAPFFADIADGPENGAAWWLNTADGVRIRVGIWRAENAKGTVLLFPGRTEYVEKYGRAAADLAARGYATLAIDWRGQGLADRLTGNPLIGHVGRFTDYQQDVAAVMQALPALDLPQPLHLIAHSMGGCIGLRAVMEGLPVNSSVFSAPMWGITMPTMQRPMAWALGWGSSRFGFGDRIAPGTRATAYVQAEPFQGNSLTRDEAMYDYMRDHLEAQPDLALGGPSLHWVHEALREMLSLARRPSPTLPCVTFLGTAEKIVDPARIETRMAHWPAGALDIIPDAEHEVMMEGADIRARVFDKAAALFDTHAQQAAPAQAKSA